MSYLTILVFVAACLAVVGAQTTTDDSPDLSPGTFDNPDGDDTDETCVARNGKDGLCVSYTYCSDDHVILPGGDIIDSELRQLTYNSSCSQPDYWCCTQEDVVAPPAVDETDTDSCLALESDTTPWSVTLFKAVDNKTKSDSPFCLGALIGSRVVLTAATCVKHALRQYLYVRVPESAEPNRNYATLHQNLHKKYNSGTHEKDFGLLLLEEDVNRGKKKPQGACIDFNKPKGDCMTLGLDENDQIVSTTISVKTGPCTNIGSASVKDQACGVLDDKVCIAAVGAPVLCESKISGAVIFGVTRSACVKDEVLIGSILESSAWIKKELDAMKIPSSVYIQK